MPEQSINEQTRQMMGMPTSGDPAIIDPTTGRPYTPDASMRQQEEITRQAEVKEEFVSEQRLQLPKDLEEEIEKEIRPKARPEGLPNVYEKKTAIDKTLEYGYLLKERQPGAKGKTRIVTGLDERNPAHQKIIKAFFDSAVGGDTGFDPTKQAWCAAFVNHILTEMGADLIESKDPYKRLRANEYKTYGKSVDLENIQEGDIVVFDFDKDGTADHVTFYAGGRITSQGEGQYINVIGGNQGGGEVSIRENEPGYTLDNVAAIRRVTYDGDAYEIAQSHKDSDPIFKTFLPEEHEDYAQAQVRRLGSYNEGGDVAAQMQSMLPSADEDTRSTKEFLQHPLETVPFFQRPMGASTDDPQVGQDDAGNPVFKGSLGEYTVRVNPDQRTLRTKVEEAIPVVKEAVGDYLEDPKLPTKDQLSEFAKQAGQSAVESVEDLGDLMFKGKGTLGDVFAVAAGAGAASVPFDVPKGALRIFGGVNAEGAYEDKNLKKAVRLLKEADVDPTNVQESYFKNKEIWEQTGWYVDPKDGQWRFEIDDSKSKLKDFKNVFNTELEPTSPAIDPKKSKNFFNEIGNVELSKEDGKYRKLSEVFDHGDFYKRYPDLKDIDVIFYSNPKNRLLLGSAGDDEIFINLSAYDNYEDIKSTLLHELQHVVQFEEGFVPGSSTSQVPQSLIENKTKELEEKKRPLTVKQAVIKNKQELLSNRIKEERKEHSKKPLPNITEKQQIEIFKLKPYNPDKNDYDGPSWASIARDYKVTPAEIKKAYGREMLLVNLAKEKKTLDLLDYKIASDLFEIEDENFNIEMEFYKGAGGEIESRLAQRRADLSGNERGPQNVAAGFPLDDRVDMLQEEGGKFQYTGSAGVDPYVYQISPRVEPDPEKPGFLSGVKKKLGLTSDSAVDGPKDFNKGGAVMNEQMEMAFMNQGGLKDDGMKRDPVSGNEIPNGSMAKEVRDDISAQLSEGEYVVPADVVRYLGVKHFEDLRDKAKQGLQSMEANGRIGGEPVPVGGPQAAPMMQPPQQMQPPMPQAPTPYSPQPAPPQMAMGGDLSPEEMNEINSIMMAQGGMVPADPYQQQQMQYAQPNMAMGAAEGTDVTSNSFMNPGGGITPGQAITMPTNYSFGFSNEPPGPSLVPRSVTLYGPNGEQEQLVLPAQQARYDELVGQGYTTTAPTDVEGSTGSTSSDFSNDSDDPIIPPTTPNAPGTSFTGFKNWGSEVNWADPESVEKFVNQQYNMPDPTLRKGAGMAGFFGAGPLAAAGTIGSLFMAGQVLDTVADLRSAVMIAKAYGNTEGAAIAQAKLDLALKGGPGYVDSTFGDMLASGTMQFAGHVSGASGLDDLPSNIDEWTKNDFTRFQSATGKKAPVKTEPTGDKKSVAGMPSGRMGFDPKSKSGGLEEARKIKQQQDLRQQSEGGDPGPSGAEIAAARAQTPTAKASTGTKTTEEARSSAASAAEKLGTGLATGGRATGGLVSRPKKKK